MTSVEKGARIGAVMSMDDQRVLLLGYGVYEGLGQPPPGRIASDAPNPKMTLDNGDIVWGFECWWGSEEQMKKQIEHYKAKGAVVENVLITSYRPAQAGGNTIN